MDIITIDNLYDLYIYLNKTRFKSIDDVKNFTEKYISKIINYIIDNNNYIVCVKKNTYEYMNKIMKVYLNYYEDNNLKKILLYDIISDENYIGRYNNITFKPHIYTKNEFNMWQGINAKNIDIIPDDVYKIINFIKEIVCNNNENKFNFIINWLKDVIIKGKKTNKHIIIYSKSICLYNIGYFLRWIVNNIIGNHHATYIESDNIKNLDKYKYILYCLIFYKRKYKFIYNFLKNINPDKEYGNYIIVTDNINNNIIDDNFIIYELDKYFIMPTNIVLDDTNSNGFYSYLLM